MKKRAVNALLAGIAGLFGLQVQAGVPIERWQLPNGALIHMAATDALPIVDVQIDFDAGSRRDPPAQAGLASVTAGMITKGVLPEGCPPPAGHKTRRTPREGGGCREPALDQNQLGEAWADLGAEFDVSASADRMSFTLRSLADPALLAKAVALAAREIGRPAFPDAVWMRERERLAAAIREANTRPGTLAGRAFDRNVYGGHPYGGEATEATLAAISTVGMRARHALTVLPCRAKLTIVGAVTRAQAERIATGLLARLPAASSSGDGACPTLPSVAEVPPLVQAVTERIPFDSAQAHVVIGQPGYPRRDPDHFALTLGNYILGGGGFVSRLTEAVREKRGLAYSVYSSFSPGLHAGAFRISFQTRPDQADEAVQVSREVLERFVAEGPTEAEVKAAKANLIGGFPLLLDSSRKLLGNVANIAWSDLPLDYLDTWTAKMNAVTASEVKAAFARKLQPQRMVTVVVGGATPAPGK